MLKKIIIITTLLLLVILPSQSYCTGKNVGDLGVITESPIHTYINGYPIDSWVIDETVYVDIKILEKYGYNVTWVPEADDYNVRFDDHIEKENKLRDYRSQKISSNGISEMWYGDWIKSIDPQTDSFNYMHGAYVYSHEYAEDAATITFSRHIPTAEINVDNIHIYSENGFDLTDYFSLDFFEKVNRLTIEPIDDVIFKYVSYDRPLFIVEISGNLKDANGQQVMTPLLHSFYMDHRYIHTNHLKDQSLPYLANNKYDYVMGDKILRDVESLGFAVWDDDKQRLQITGKNKGQITPLFKEIATSTYPNIISDINVADSSNSEENGYSVLSSTNRDTLGLLDAPVAKGIYLDQFIQLQPAFQGPPYYNKRYTAELDGQRLIAPEKLPSGYCDLMLLEGLTLENGSVLNESIYFKLYISEH